MNLYKGQYSIRLMLDQFSKNILMIMININYIYFVGGNTNYHSNGPTSLQNGHAAMSNGHTDPDDKWYMKDSMRPVGASVHGDNCKCYRCQRKLTAI